MNGDGPKRLNTQQVLEVNNIHDFKRIGLRIVIDVTMLRIDIEKEHLEASETLNAETRAIELVLIAHDFLEDICPTAFI